MTITSLPPTTIHLLGSSQTLTTSLSLVKELVDNALDSKARSVDVLISQNTLDKVEIRDNGHGISQADFDALGRRGHTSKLRSFDELKSVGGLTLGFRGEALASAVQLGEVTITTRTEGDVVATCVVLKAPGGILKQSKTSHPVGTTVCVKNLFSRIPVRQQTALKQASKMLVKIKGLLQNYALARPTVKFNLKIMKESRGSWSYVPRPSEGIRGAVTQVIGRDAATECLEKSLSFPDRRVSSSPPAGSVESLNGEAGVDSQMTEDGFVVQMFLPKRDADPTKIAHGQYVSVDSRPVANDKGTMKKIIILFKAYIKGSHVDTVNSIKNPFFRMNLICPVASYDPNVEPAKDDILFANEDWVIESIEAFFKKFYGDHEKVPVHCSKQVSNSEDIGFKLLLARQPFEVSDKILDEALSPHIEPRALPTDASQQSIDLSIEGEGLDSDDDPMDAKVAAHKRIIDMSNDLSEKVEDLQPRQNAQFRHDARQPSDLDLDLGNKVSSNLNPWVIAKLTTPVRPRVDVVTILPDPNDHIQLLATQNLPTPRPSSDPPIPETRIQSLASRGPRWCKVSNPYHLTPKASRESLDFQTKPQFQRDPGRKVHVGHEGSQESQLLVGDDATEFARRNDFISAKNVTEEYISHVTIPESVKLPKKSRVNPDNLNKPFISPLINLHYPSETNLQGAYQIPPTEVNVPQEDPDLGWSMDYENRKEEISRQHRLKVKATRAKVATERVVADPDVDVVRTSPHKNRYQAALVTLSQGEQLPSPPAQDAINKRPIKTTLPDGDPRAYLIRRQRSMSVRPGAAPKPTRLRSNRLPLERVPETEELHSLILPVPASIDTIRNFASKVGEEDLYIQNGNLGNGFMSERDTSDIVAKIKDVAMKWKETKTDGNLEFEYSFGSLAQMGAELLR